MATEQEIILDEHAFLVSETDNKGIITFANSDFCKIAKYDLTDLIGKPHNIIRHQDMPKAAFTDLWKTIKEGNVWTGYVKNKTKDGGYYWVFATVIHLNYAMVHKDIYLVEEKLHKKILMSILLYIKQ